MSHLLKKDKKILLVIKLALFVPLIWIFSRAILDYSGHKLIYFLFSIISFYMIYFSFRKKSLFYENFFGVFLFLGFWFKFSVILSFNLGYGEGIDSAVLISPQNFDDALIVSIFGFLGFIFYGHLREIYIYYPSKIELTLNLPQYQKYRSLIISIFICLILSVCFANIHFKIYQRGLIGENYHFLISGFIKTSLLYFLSFCSAIILYFDLIRFKKIFILLIFIFILETFFSSISMLSRGMIFNSLALLFALYKFTNKLKIDLSLSFFVKILIFLIISFFISVASVNYLRIHFHGIGVDLNDETKIQIINKSSDQFEKSEKGKEIKKSYNKELFDLHTKQSNFKVYNNGIFNLIVYRWVGIEPLLIITKNKDQLNFKLFKESLYEKFRPNSPSFYETKFGLKPLGHNQLNPKVKGNTLPGIIAFLFFSGSYAFLFFSIFIFCFFASILEFLTFRLLEKNMLASSVIAMTISYRYAHFGYLPKQSYLLFGSIIGLIIMLFFIKNLYKKFNKINTNS